MRKSIAQKLNLTDQAKGAIVNASQKQLPNMELPGQIISDIPSEKCDYLHLFVVNEKQFLDNFPVLIKLLNPKGALWVSWPKNKGLGTDLNLKEIIRLGYNFNMVESTCLSIDVLWSALKFTFPKPGKKYNNSYGKHPI